MVSQIITYSPLKLTGLTQYRLQAPFSLRQHGTFVFICVSFLRSASAKTKHEKKMKYRCE
jgi:hypothetical protein